MSEEKIFNLNTTKVYECLVNKVVRKNQSKDDVDKLIFFLLGYNQEQLDIQLNRNISYKQFFDEAPYINPCYKRITGSICGIKLSEIQNSTIRVMRCLDKLIDDLTKGKQIDKIIDKLKAD